MKQSIKIHLQETGKWLAFGMIMLGISAAFWGLFLRAVNIESQAKADYICDAYGHCGGEK